MSGLRIGSTFSGYGGLERGVQAVLGGDVVWHCEYEPPSKQNPRPSQAAAKLLAYRYPDVPNLGDITAVEWAEVEPVDVLTGGFPCTDVSSAGKQAGLRPDTRSGLWTHLARAINVLRPRLVVAENVRGLLSADAACDLEPCPWCLGDDEGRPLRALGAVLGDLAVLGYDAQWVGVRASDAEAPHARFRVIICAWPAGVPYPVVGDAAGVGRHPTPVARLVGDPEPARPVGGPGGVASDSDGDAVREQPVAQSGGSGAAVAVEHGAGSTAADADDDGREGRQERDRGQEGGQPAPSGGDAAGCVLDWGEFEPAIRRWELRLGRPAPAPTRRGSNGGSALNPVFVEWMQGLPEGWVTDVPGITAGDQLRMLGNGVVPQQVELALRYLLAADASERAA